MREAKRFVDITAARTAYLLCNVAQSTFYAKCGWTQIYDVTIRSNTKDRGRKLVEEENCFVYDPTKQLLGSVVLIGSVF